MSSHSHSHANGDLNGLGPPQVLLNGVGESHSHNHGRGHSRSHTITGQDKDLFEDVQLNKTFEFGGSIVVPNGGSNSNSRVQNPFVSRTPSPEENKPRIDDGIFVSQSKVRTSIFSALIDTIPVLASFPTILLSADLAHAPASYETVGSYVISLVVSTMLAGTFLLMLRLLSRFNVISLHKDSKSEFPLSFTLSKSAELQSTVLLLLGLSFSFLSTNFLSIQRVSTLYLGLYLNRLNICTPIFLLIDLYSFYSDSNYLGALNVVLGYVLVVVSYLVLYRKVIASSLSNTINNLNLQALLATFIIMGLVLVFFDISGISPIMIGVNIAASAVYIISLQEADLKSSRIVPSFLSTIACALEFAVLSENLTFMSLVSVILPVLIVPDRSMDIPQDSSSMSRSSSSEGTSSSLLRELLSHSDTRAIFNFLLLNTTFMFVQLLYSFRSKSLGLLSDSLHMALDCTSLALGLIAGVLSKNAINPHGKYPFGLKNFEILAGFTNGTLLIGISGSIIFEAIGRLFNPISLQKTNELIIVSILGLGVNLVGIFAFNHGHTHGHSHGHSHVSSEEHSHEHTHGHSHTHEHSHSHGGHGEEGMNDNMKGIFLHILADTLGSVGVVISTILTKYFHWNGFDPIASIIIAVLILLSAIPLIKSTASTLLLKLTKEKENKIRTALNDVTDIKGVKSFTTSRFWPNSSNSINGYVHIQVYRGENTSYIKRQCERIFETENIDVMIQIENDYDTCWCRSKDGVVPS
ncbi:cation efflux family-domain-containing protein [Scheffersomyces xylosifermentans]|uniref:cation efflux family-domain-containing protein n=1 Tax=Scheffersomyces xylosifermentans TaxID=1304137 RepID=UPI00315DB2DC